MKVAIYELIHFECIFPYIDLMQELNAEVTFIVSLSFAKELSNNFSFNNNKFKWHFIDNDSSLVLFQKELSSILRKDKYDLFILNSLDSRHIILYYLLKKFNPKKILLTLHDINNFFTASFGVKIKKNIRTLGKKLLHNLIDGFLVNTFLMKQYIEENKFTRKNVYHLPLVLYKSQFSENRNKISFVIPGSIDERRRNYDFLLNALEEISNKNVEFTFAGGPVGKYGNEIINRINKLLTRGFKIIYFKEEVSEKEFQEIINNASALISPLVHTTAIHDNINEVYSVSKTSGNINDAIRNAKPLLLPIYINVPAEIKSSCIFYTSEIELVHILNNLINDKKVLNYYNSEAISNASNFSKENIFKLFSNILKEIDII